MQGVDIWKQWREEHDHIVPDLIGANLFEANLSGANLFYANLGGANLVGAHFRGANLFRAKLSGKSFPHAYIHAAVTPTEQSWYERYLSTVQFSAYYPREAQVNT